MSLQNLGFLLTVTLVDQGGNKSVQRYELTAAAYADADSAATVIVAAIDAVTDAAVVAYALSELHEEDTTFFGSGEVENVASISARIDASEMKYATVRIPAPVDGIFQASTGPLYNVVDPSDAALVTYLSLFETGSEILLSDGEALADVATAGNVTGKRIHRKSRKG